MLVNVLILFFLGLILYQIFLANTYFIEGLENNSQATNTEMQTSIEDLNSEIDLLSDKISESVKKNDLSEFVKKVDTALVDVNQNFTNVNSKISQLDKKLAESAGGLMVAASGLAGATSVPTKTT